MSRSQGQTLEPCARCARSTPLRCAWCNTGLCRVCARQHAGQTCGPRCAYRWTLHRYYYDARRPS